MKVQNHYLRLVRKLPLLVLFVCLALPCLALTDTVLIDDFIFTDDTVEEQLTVTLVNNTLPEIKMTLPPGVSHVTLGAQLVTVENGTITIPLNCKTCKFTLSYVLKNVIISGTQYHTYARTLNFPSTLSTLIYAIHLPPGHGVTSYEEDPSVVPSPSKLETDGEKIIITWVEDSPELPKRYYVAYSDLETLTFSLQDFYEELTEWPVWILMFLMLGIGLGAGVWGERWRTRRKEETALPAVSSTLLSPDEQTLIIAVKKAGDDVSQKELGKMLSWSKSKVSAIVTGLEYKQLLAREKHGRSRKVKLLKRVETEKN